VSAIPEQFIYIFVNLRTMNILAIGAHPDDIELGCGGMLLKTVKHGHKVFMYTLTKGEACGDPEQRKIEQMESSRIIGAKASWIDNFEDTKLSPSIDLINHIEQVIKITRPDIIYTHPEGDTHHDHRAVASATFEAARFIPTILSYEMPVTKDFKPQLYYDISDVIDEKIKLINIFTSQSEKIFLKSDAIKGLSQYRALQSRIGSDVIAVEAFEVMKIGLAPNLNLLHNIQESIQMQEPEKYLTPLIQDVTVF
jgi:LmbE family N-acetylglucosaminyl deacetylase